MVQNKPLFSTSSLIKLLSIESGFVIFSKYSLQSNVFHLKKTKKLMLFDDVNSFFLTEISINTVEISYKSEF